MLAALWQRLDGCACLVEPPYRRVIAMGPADCVDILSDHVDGAIPGLSDGTTMTGAEFLSVRLARLLGSDIFMSPFHPSRGREY